MKLTVWTEMVPAVPIPISHAFSRTVMIKIVKFTIQHKE